VQAKLNYPILEWKAIFEFADRILSENKIEHTILAHAGSGICLISLLLDQGDRDSMDKAVEAMGQLLDRSRETGGNLVITRAPTDIKRNLKIWGKQGPDFIIMKRLKEELDPLGIMSPGRFVGGL
jgi:glycolate oxidase FAD binding subunit